MLKLEKISLSKIEVIETVQSDNRLQPQFKQTLWNIDNWVLLYKARSKAIWEVQSQNSVQCRMGKDMTTAMKSRHSGNTI